MTSSTRTVSLVLGSGGARGLAHVGIIEVLTEQGFTIKSIAGTSMGALIGGIYAAGKLEVYRDWVCEVEKLDVLSLLDFSFSRSGLFKGERIIDTLKELIGDRNIENLPISFTAVATDLDSEKEIWLNKGSLFNAIRASIAIPTVFTPLEYHGMRLVDGSLVNPIPIAPTLNDMTDITIAVNLSAKADPTLKEREPEIEHDVSHSAYRQAITGFINRFQTKSDKNKYESSFLDIITQSIDVMQNKVARSRLAAYSTDIIIDIPRNVSTFYEFYRARELIEIGRQKAEEALLTAKLF